MTGLGSLNRWGRRAKNACACIALLIGVLGAQPAIAQNDTDPFEPLNRSIYGFNDALDQALIKPAAQTYARYMPELFQVSLRNFFSNLTEPWTGVNSLLQGKPRQAVSDFGRFFLNFALTFGLNDIASELGLARSNEDFGQTLGVWGVEAGPYLVLPILGPSSVRDGIGRITDILTDPSRKIKGDGDFYALTAARIVDLRVSLLPADRMLDSIALDRYTFIRNAYLQRRQSLVNDGNTPPPKE